MKKIVSIILLLIGLYIISIFAFPSVSSYIWEKLWLTSFNESIIKFRDNLNDFVTNFDLIDLIWKYNDTKKQVLEIKQNVETQFENTKKKIEVIQTNVDKTAKSFNDTINSLNELQNSIEDILPKSVSWNTSSWNSN